MVFSYLFYHIHIRQAVGCLRSNLERHRIGLGQFIVSSVERLFVRELSPQSYGNAVGIGLADVTTDRLVSHIDWTPTMVNAQTAGSPSRIRLPIHFPTDRECLAWVASTVGKPDPSQVTFGWIRNTLELDRMAVSDNLRSSLAGNPQIEIEDAIDVPWDAGGDLKSPFVPRG